MIASYVKSYLAGLAGFPAIDMVLTNQATVKDWPLVVTLVDLPWGTVPAAVVSSVGYLVGTRLR